MRELTGMLAHARGIARQGLLAALVGVLAGLAAALFLVSLGWATEYQAAHPTLLYALPLAGVGLVWLYRRHAGVAARGTAFVIGQVTRDDTPIPGRMAPLILVGTVVTHLFGGSAGREGTALQMGASLADVLHRLLRIPAADRAMMLLAGLAGGFGAVFGTPLAGCVFAMEVPARGQMRLAGLWPCLVAALSGDQLVRILGVPHAHYPQLSALSGTPVLLLKVALAGCACGLASRLFLWLLGAINQASMRLPNAFLRPLLGGLVVITATTVLGTRDYLGLSLPLLARSVTDASIEPLAFLAKLFFTAVTLGSGFLGGEVTPLFVIGATLGHTLGGPLGVDPALLASLAFVAVFAGASKTPLACALMGIELFGGGAALYFLVICACALLASGRRGVYASG